MARVLSVIHPRAQALANQLVALSLANGVRIEIGECLRTVAEQDAIYAQGRTKPGIIVTKAKGSTYSSMHQWGVAFDIYLVMDVDGDGKTSDDAFNNQTKLFDKVGALGRSLGLIWGQDWGDKPHFQLADWGGTASKLKSLYGTPQKFFATWGNASVATAAVQASASASTTQLPFKYLVLSLQKALNIELKAGIKEDGLQGIKTLAKTPTLDISTGAKKPLTVRAMQYLVANHGVGIEATGVFDLPCEVSVKAFQSSIVGQTRPDGELTGGKSSWKKLLRIA